MPTFCPNLLPGVQLDVTTREDRLKYTTALSFFQLLFTAEFLNYLCLYTNKYAQAQFDKSSLEAGWFVITLVKMYKYIALLFYMSISRLPNTELYWCTESFFHGNCARAFMSKKVIS